MDRLETRELSYFLAVAEQLHIGRAASSLGIAQPALSKAIQRMERRLDTELLDRSGRGIALTGAGEVLARDARIALDAVAAAGVRAQRAGRPNPRLALAIKPGGDAGLLPAILVAYEKHPDVLPIEVVFGGDRARMLHEGQADAALLYSPPDDVRGLDTEPLLRETPVAVLPASHRYAARHRLCQEDLEGEQLHRHDPQSIDSTDTLSGLMHLIALGREIAVLPRSLTIPLRDDLVTVPMSDLPPSELVLAWPAKTTSASVAALVAAAQDVAIVDD